MTSIQKTDSLPEPGPGDNRETFRAALEKARHLCAAREYCVNDIKLKAPKWNLRSEETVRLLTDILVSEGFIDERRYARAFANDKLRYNKWGKIKIAYNLRQKLIPGQIIDFALKEIDEDEYVAMAKNLITTLLKAKKDRDSYLVRAGIVRSMMGRGFEPSLTNRLLDSLIQ